MVCHLGRQVGSLLENETTHLPHNPAMLLLGPQGELKACSCRDLYTNCISILFITARILELTPMASTGEWINK